MIKNPLNAVDGNTLLMYSSVDDYDLYQCKECNKCVKEDEWNNKRNMCYSCWWKI